MIKLGIDEMDFISMFESKTGASVKDCIVNGRDITFIVKEGDVGLAIGKKGAIINRVKKELDREIHVYEHSNDIQKFVINLLYPVRVEKVEVEDDEIKVYINPLEKKRAIGKGGKKINNVKNLVSRHFGVDKIVVV
jgi:N utilization substance protein A